MILRCTCRQAGATHGVAKRVSIAAPCVAPRGTWAEVENTIGVRMTMNPYEIYEALRGLDRINLAHLHRIESLEREVVELRYALEQAGFNTVFTDLAESASEGAEAAGL